MFNSRGLTLTADADPLLGPILADSYGPNRESYEFIAPTIDWNWKAYDYPPGCRFSLPAINEEGARSYTLYTQCVFDQAGVPTWYAFSHYDERAMARNMVTADNVGWKIAVTILSKTPWRAIQQMIAEGDRESFKDLPKIGPKTGDKLIAVLFNKEIVKPVVEGKPKKAAAGEVNEDVVASMVVLGWKVTLARKIVGEVQAIAGNKDLTTDDLLRVCLRSMSK